MDKKSGTLEENKMQFDPYAFMDQLENEQANKAKESDGEDDDFREIKVNLDFNEGNIITGRFGRNDSDPYMFENKEATEM